MDGGFFTRIFYRGEQYQLLLYFQSNTNKGRIKIVVETLGEPSPLL
jgi:hypothetical protein